MKIYKRLSVILLIIVQTFVCLSQNVDVKSGKWLLEMTTSDIGTVRAVMNFDFEDSSYVAYSRENADRAILGYGTSTLGRVFTKSFKKGSLLHIINGKFKVQNDTIILKGIFTSAMGSYYFNGWIFNNELKAQLSTRSNEIKGTITGSSDSINLPLEKYENVYSEAHDLTLQRIYSPSIIESKDWKKFDKKMRKVTPKVQDDLEMVFAFFYYGGKLPFSHFSLIKIPDSNESEIETYDSQVFLEEKSQNTGYLKIKSFGGSVEEMDSIMTILKSKNYNNLIVDLRDNSGGSVASGLTFVTNIVDTAFYGGVFLTQKWFTAHDEVPTIEAYNQFPIFSQANFDLIIEGIHNEEGLCLQVVPASNPYTGKVFILINGKTASTCEPIIYGLKQLGRAIIVGQTSAGAMMNGEIFALKSGFSLVVPTATYYTSDGYLIDGKGVIPNHESTSENALEYVLENLIIE